MDPVALNNFLWNLHSVETVLNHRSKYYVVSPRGLIHQMGSNEGWTLQIVEYGQILWGDDYIVQFESNHPHVCANFDGYCLTLKDLKVLLKQLKTLQIKVELNKTGKKVTMERQKRSH